MMNTGDKKKMVGVLLAAGISLSAAISGVFLVAPSEGKVNHTYLDPVNILSSCYGHTGPELKLGQKFTDQQCLDQLADDLSEAEDGVEQEITVPLNTYQKAALISFVYNVGQPALHRSTMRVLFNQGDYTDGCDQLLSWVYANKKKLAGLEARRELERSMCLNQMELPNVSDS
jgi:lysozyme